MKSEVESGRKLVTVHVEGSSEPQVNWYPVGALTGHVWNVGCSDKSGSPQELNSTLSPTSRYHWKMLCFRDSC